MMYIRTVNVNSSFGTHVAFIGPFTSNQERKKFIKACKRVMGAPGFIVTKIEKLPKDRIAISVEYAKFLLSVCESAK